MKPDSSKTKMRADSCTTGRYTDVYHINSKEQTMDSSSDCKFIYSTPQVRKAKHDIQGSATTTVHCSYSVDSGISDTFNSTRTSSINDISSLSADTSPEREAGHKRFTLKAYECSPIKRVSSTCIQGRRLMFTEPDLQTVEGFSVSEIETSKKETVELCEKSTKCQTVVDNVNQIDSLSIPKSLSLCSYEGQSRSSSPDSAIADDLEVSLQDMVLVELSPHIACTPSLNLKSSKCDRGQQSYIFNEQKNALQTGSNTFPRGCTCCHPASDLCTDKSVDKAASISQASQTETPVFHLSPHWTYREAIHPDFFNTQTFHHRADSKLKFLNKLCLTPASLTPQTLKHAASEQSIPYITDSRHSTAALQLFPDRKIPPGSEFIQTYANFRVPDLHFQQYTFPWSRANQPDRCDSFVNSNYDNLKGFAHNNPQNLYPNKRSSDCKETCSSPFSPTKVRRTDNMLISEARASAMEMSRKSVSRWNHFEKKNSSVLDCGTFKVDNLCLYNSASLHVPIQRPIEEAQSTCDIKLENPATFWFNSCYINNSDNIDQETALDNFNNGDRVKEILQKVKKFCPYDSSRLIGRNVGIGKFDIVCELYLQNFHLCLAAIFHYLADSDLASILAVSTSWKLAFYSEHRAYNRYRQHKRNLSRIHHGSGKENTGRKPPDATSSLALTQSRGLLSSMQSQAQAKTAPDPPTTAVEKDVLMCDDTLRVCPHCQGPAMIKQCQDRAVCMSNKCSYDFCTLCFTAYHLRRPCKPLCKAPSKADLAGTKKSKKNLKRL